MRVFELLWRSIELLSFILHSSNTNFKNLNEIQFFKFSNNKINVY